jgi:GT2 family glycosyltransferase/glycosyltransferase involved in cell wall biosynthesis
MTFISLLHILVGSAPVATNDPTPTLIIEAELERLEAMRQSHENAENRAEWFFHQAVLSAAAQQDLTWYRFSDERYDGPIPLERWREFFPNLQLRQPATLRSQTLANILAQWPAALENQSPFHLTIRQGDPIEILKGAGSWLSRIERIELQGPKADVLWEEACGNWLAQQGFHRASDASLSWVLDPRALQLIQQRAEIENLKEQLSTTLQHQPQKSEDINSALIQAFEALHLIFPYAAYRKKRPDLADFNDSDLISHYIEYGIREGIDLNLSTLLNDPELKADSQREDGSESGSRRSSEPHAQSMPLQEEIEPTPPVASLLDELEISAWLAGNHLYLTVPEEVAASITPAIYKGTQGYGLKRVSWSKEILNQLSQSRVYQLLSAHNRHYLKVLDRSPDTHFLDSGINQIDGFALHGGDTLHLHLSDSQQGVKIPLVENFQLTCPASELWSFEGLLAVHRGKGRLEIITTHKQTSKTYWVDFQQDKIGGTSRKKYLLAKLEFPLEEGTTTLTINITDIQCVSEIETRHDSYFFIANPNLRCCGLVSKPWDASLKPRTLRNDQECRTSQALFSAIVSPFSSAEDPSLVFSPGHGKTTPLFAPLRQQVHLRADHCHALVISAQPSGTFSLFINGSFSELITVSSDLTPMDLPLHWLRGEPIQIEIRDSSGSQIFLSHGSMAPRFSTPEDVILKESKPPFPTNLTLRANYRYQALRQHLSQPISGVSSEHLLQALETLDRNYETLQLAPLDFPFVSDPEVSIVIPAHNNVNATFYCLSALLLAHNKATFEIILVDDGSTDETVNMENWVHGIRVIHNEKPLRFIQACNRGVREAKGKFVVLLNNDTEVTVGWLDALLDAFQRFEHVGAVGSKLLYPDGRLQDAGGIVWSSGNPWNYGHGMNPWDPRFCYARQVDYLSGAALMTTKLIWDEVGGLSQYLDQMYFEDTDFSFKVREAGYKTYFIPSSIVYHFEGTTSGVDLSSGFKKYQEINRPKFKRCWAKAFARHGEEGIQPDLEKDRGIIGRILFIDYATPREDHDAGSYAALREIKLVQSLGYKVTFLPMDLNYLAAYSDELTRDGVEVITEPFYLSLASFIRKRAKEFDAAYITRYNVAREAVDLIREHSPKTRILLNNADLHFLRELRAALISKDHVQMETMRIIREQELEIMRRVDLVLSYNEVEHTLITSHTDGQVKVMTCPWVVDCPDLIAPLAGRQGLSFLGGFKHRPNPQAVHWFCRDVMPLLEEQKVTLTIYGSDMGQDLKDLASEWIRPIGHIKSVAEAYEKHRVFVVPLLSGAGIKGKVITALAYGIPTVLSPIAAEGIGLRHGYDCYVARKPEDWLSAITELLHNDDLWRTMSDASRSYAASQFSLAAGKTKMKAALEAVDLYSPMDE